jgi:hypothetical protein
MTDDQRPGTNDQSTYFAVGDRVRLSPAGKARLRQMPEAWGMHAAAARDEVGEVIEVIEGEAGRTVALSVEFESGAVYNWDVDQFARVVEE